MILGLYAVLYYILLELLVEVLNIYQSINQVFVNTAKVATLPEQDKFTPNLDTDCCYAEKNIKSAHADMEQTTLVSYNKYERPAYNF